MTRLPLSLAAVALLGLPAVTSVPSSAVASAVGAAADCAPDNAGLKLAPGLCASLVVDSLPAPRHLDVAPNGDIIVGLAGRPRDAAPIPGGVIILRPLANGGVERMKFGDFRASSVKLIGNQLYTENTTAILRYTWNLGTREVTGPDTIVSGLPGDRSHQPKTFAIHGNDIYVNHGSPSNSCQEADRSPGSKGKDPCDELTTRAGIWRYDRNKTGQTLASGERFATGIRNAVAIAVHPSGQLYVVQHGRDNLSSAWPAIYTEAQNAETPAEELFAVNRGDDFGWPYCFFDPALGKKVLAPEYGGDGKTEGRCTSKKGNVGHFPGHWAPNGLLFYTGSQLPAKYRNGAFIVFHGSWNRTPLPNQGFKVVFQPMSNGRASGPFEVVVDGFRVDGNRTTLDGRPMALAQAPDGSLYLSDDERGRIWKISAK